MNRMIKMGGASFLAASMLAGSLALAGAGAASATAGQRHSSPGSAGAALTSQRVTSTKPAAPAACSARTRSYSLPNAPTWYRAGTAGSVMVGKVNSGTIKVVRVSPARGWRALVDSSSGSSVDVYFHQGKHTLKFEAEINDAGGLTVRVTSC